MNELDPLPDTAEHYRVLAHQIAGAKGHDADLLMGPLPHLPFPTVDADPGQVSAKRRRRGLRQRQGRSAWGVFLEMVVGFDQLHVEILAQKAGGLLNESNQHVYAHAHVGGDDHAHPAGQLGDGLLLGRVEPRRADHGGEVQRGRLPQMVQARGRRREIDENVPPTHRIFRSVDDGDAHLPDTRDRAGVFPHGGMPGDFKRAAQLEVIGLPHRTEVASPHPSGRPRDNRADHGRVPLPFGLSPLPPAGF